MKTVIVTGASSGIGYETARILALKGYEVIGIGRSKENCDAAKDKIMSENSNCKISFYTADLMQQREVNRVAGELEAYIEEHCGGGLWALINNAGCVRSWYTTTEEG